MADAVSYIATLVERHTGYVMLAKVAGKDTRTVVTALIKQAKKLPKELYKSLTWDRGKELTDHRRFTLATKIDVYFCDPQSPWQRGSNENTNGLLRQYFPKGADLSVHSQAYLNKVARQLNERPREDLQFATPRERFSTCVASTRCAGTQLQAVNTVACLVAVRARSGGAQHKALIERLRHAQAANEIGANVDIERAARFVETTMFGLQVAAKAGASLQSLRDTASFAIASLRKQ